MSMSPHYQNEVKPVTSVFGHRDNSYNKFRSHSASLHADANAINSDAMDESRIHVCFLEPQETVPLPRVKIHQDVDE
ncbi:hypothetical protein LIER_01865 [Lithospermum erythrorhizon]|uniref:Uncharacterized protein n=1 Tax=Lithospermum erythrorhizon TaxID=34254 RepID=A0AAV3NNK0_LITER